MKTSLNVDTQGLREKILDLAMQGKLVKQDAGDEPASALLEKIKAEKAELVKEGKIKKSKKLPEITDDEKPFDIPDSWEWVRLGDLLIPEKSKAPTEDFVYLDIASIDNKVNKIINPKTINVSKEKIPSRARMVVEPGDILFSLVRPYLRNIAIVPVSDSNLVASTGFYVIKPINIIDFKYVFYTVLSDYVVNGLTRKYMKGDNSPSVKKGDIQNYPIPLPPLAVQKRIADKVSELFKQVDIVEKNVAEYQDLEQAMRSKLLDLAMRGKLVEQDPTDEPASELVKQIQADKAELVKEGKIKKSKKLPKITDDEKPFDIPDSWEWVRLGDINEYMGRSINPQEYGEEKFELYSVPVFKKNYPEIISGSEIKSSKQKVFFDDVLLCKINPRINRVWVVSNFTEFESIASSEWIVIRQPNVDSSFLKYCLSAPYFRAAIQENVSGVGGSLTRAKPTIVKELIIPLPSLAEQKRIADKLTRLFEDLDTIKQNLATVS
ncbi:restriction endonuclease subunit S [Lactobacillus delbrueckii]|uniref:restriction endonuclease subunit S n=1 Tax=Lactobacillus delbrueckii TaxID=1584 RepID=UPI0039C14851